MKKILILPFILILFQVLSAQNFAYVNKDSLLLSIPNYQIKLKSLNETKENFVQELQKNKTELQNKTTSLFSLYNPQTSEDTETIKKRMSKQDLAKLDLLTEESKLIQKKEDTYNDILNTQYNKEIRPLLNQIDEIIKNYSQKNKIDIVYSISDIASSLVYINQDKNITNKIIKEIKNKIN